MHKLEKFKFVGVMIIADRDMGEEEAHRLLEGRKVWGKMVKLWKENVICREVKRELYEGVVIPTVVYGSETWSSKCTREEKNRGI